MLYIPEICPYLFIRKLLKKPDAISNMICPSCNAEITPEQNEQCPRCGTLFEKSISDIGKEEFRKNTTYKGEKQLNPDLSRTTLAIIIMAILSVGMVSILLFNLY